MFLFIRERSHTKFNKVFAVFALVCFMGNSLLPSLSFAQGVLSLPAVGTMIHVSEPFTPALIKGLQLDQKNPLKFNFIIDTGHSKLSGEELKRESNKLIRYFLSALTVPDDQLWVNLSPVEKDRIVADGLATTEMGRDMLAQDYILKQITASLVYPEGELGKKFWAKVRQMSQERFGTADVPVDTFNKVWIVPRQALIYEHNGTAFVVENRLKVMLEEDYLAMEQSEVRSQKSEGTSSDLGPRTSDPKTVNSLGSQIVREIVLPELEKDVNTGKNFANLRQIANAVVLAWWYKQNLKESLLGKVYVDQNKVKGIDLAEKDTKLKIYNQYLAALKAGVYNYIKEDYDPVTKETLPRKYFSGGTDIQYDGTTARVVRGALEADVQERVADGTAPVGSSFAVEAVLGENPTNPDAAELAEPRADVSATASPVGQINRWLGTTVSPQEFNPDMFRDYDYRSTIDVNDAKQKSRVMTPAMAFRLGITWADMAIAKAEKAGIIDRTVLLARDARKIEPELVDALVAALRYRGLNVVYIADKGTNSVTSYSWAVQQLNPLMSIFITASHVSQPENIIVRGFKVAMLTEKGGNIQSLSTQEIKSVSMPAVKELIDHPEFILSKRADQEGTFTPLDITENVVRFNALVGNIAAADGSLYELAKALKSGQNPLDILTEFENRYAQVQQPLKGLKIVIDGSHTESGKIAAATMESLGAEVILLNGDIQEVSGEHQADPSKGENLRNLERVIKENNAHLGMAFDLDGDRGHLHIPVRSPDSEDIKFVGVAPDNAIVTLLPSLISNWGYNQPGMRVGVIRDVLGTFGVNNVAEQQGATTFQTDAGYVFLKALKEIQERSGFVFPIYGERSGHTWLHVAGEIENPLSVAILFATLVKKQQEEGALNPVLDVYNKNTISYSQSPRFMPLFHPDLLIKLSADQRNTTGWKFDPTKPTKPPQAIIAMGKDYAISELQRQFTAGKVYQTPVGAMTVKEFNSYQDAPEEGGLFRFADIVFELNGQFAGRFVFRASSNDPAFVASYETPGKESPEVDRVRQSVAGLVLDFLSTSKIAIITYKDMALVEADETKREKAFKNANLVPVEKDLDAFLREQGKSGVASRAIVDSASSVEPDVDDDGLSSDFSPVQMRIQPIGDFAQEKAGGAVVGGHLHTVLTAGTPSEANYLKGGFGQPGYGVAAGAVNDGSHALGAEGDQGYYVDRTGMMDSQGNLLSGNQVFVATTEKMADFFKRRAERNGKPVRLVIKTGIGGQHTPFQGIATVFQAVDQTTGLVVGEYELGKDFEASITEMLAGLNADWSQVAVIPSSKSGSTDETMTVFVEIFKVLLNKIAQANGMNGQVFAQSMMDYLHSINFENMKEIAGADLFKKFDLNAFVAAAQSVDNSVTVEKARKTLATVLGNMFFETTDRPRDSRLSAFIRNSRLDQVLGEDAPGFGAMFDNVGGRWTGDLHMMTFLAFYGLDAQSYWQVRRDGIAQVREGVHSGNLLGDLILDHGIKKIALVVPDELFWFGKSSEQNFNESIWQNGFANLRAIRASVWEKQKQNYTDVSQALVINLTDISIGPQFNVVNVTPVDMGNKQTLAEEMGRLFTTFYGMTYTVGNRLIERALQEAGFNSSDADISDLNNPATQIVQQNLFLRQPFVELGKGLLEGDFNALQAAQSQWVAAGRVGVSPIEQAVKDVVAAAARKEAGTNVGALQDTVSRISDMQTLAVAIKNAALYARSQNRTFVPFIYLEGEKFMELRRNLEELGIEWVLQGTGDQHISYQQVLANPQAFLPFFISFVPQETDFAPANPAIGFVKGYLDQVSSNLQRDYFARASYQALTVKRAAENGEGVFVRVLDNDENLGLVRTAFTQALNDPELQTPQTQTDLGGINLDPRLFKLQIKRDGQGIPLPMYDQSIETMTIDGFVPVILNITPFDIAPILGVAPRNDQEGRQILSLHIER